MIKKYIQNEKYSQIQKNFTSNLKQYINYYNIEKNFSEIIILCIGTNKIMGDMIGPMVGENLKSKIITPKNKKLIVFGNMTQTLNLKNANNIINKVKNNYQNPFVITIDTALSKIYDSKKIYINQGNIQIGSALSKGINCDSHINIKGVVGKYKENLEENLNTLRNVKLRDIVYLSMLISNGIIETMKSI